jgi:hypothetical protein
MLKNISINMDEFFWKYSFKFMFTHSLFTFTCSPFMFTYSWFTHTHSRNNILAILFNYVDMFILSFIYSIHYVYYKSIVKFIYFVYYMLFFCDFCGFFVFDLCLGCFLLFMWVSFGFVVCPWSIVPKNLFWRNIFQSWRWTQLQPWIKKPFSRTILEC